MRMRVKQTFPQRYKNTQKAHEITYSLLVIKAMKNNTTMRYYITIMSIDNVKKVRNRKC